jgi:hypothetical protein
MNRIVVSFAVRGGFIPASIAATNERERDRHAFNFFRPSSKRRESLPSPSAQNAEMLKGGSHERYLECFGLEPNSVPRDAVEAQIAGRSFKVRRHREWLQRDDDELLGRVARWMESCVHCWGAAAACASSAARR